MLLHQHYCGPEFETPEKIPGADSGWVVGLSSDWDGFIIFLMNMALLSWPVIYQIERVSREENFFYS